MRILVINDNYNNMNWQSLPHSKAVTQVGLELRKLRKARKLSQDDVAELTGLNRMTISKLERGGSLTVDSLLRLLRAYGMIDRLAQLLELPEPSPMEKLRNNAS